MAIRLSLMFLMLAGLLVGVWALIFPLHFYTAFPGFGHFWISRDGPYNEHLVRDVGGLNLGLALLAGLGLFRPGLAAPVTVGTVSMVYNLPHFIFHMSELELYSPIDQIGNTVSLGLALVASVILLFIREAPAFAEKT